MAAATSAAAERCLLRLSSLLAGALPNQQCFGEEEAGWSRKVRVDSGEMW